MPVKKLQNTAGKGLFGVTMPGCVQDYSSQDQQGQEEPTAPGRSAPENKPYPQRRCDCS